MHRWMGLLSSLMTVGILGFGCTPAISDLPPGGVREIVLITSNMRFIGEKPDSIKGLENPDIIVYLNDKVKITIKNRETNLIIHDFAISNYPEARAKQAIRPTEETTVEFTASRPGDFTYYCRNHQTSMYGRFIVLRR
ncbi:MAG: cupredoxin domain-containing protein [Candidatus Bipolaricaulota bacterium]|nr:cupredoxin domain-containing protein [Candidatus Bipolaricaulota bacterium]MCS7274648.1 cupredoxin domain-containing protein [Candidatus Bipolaricaulota bacterium]MDW8110921.1 cupredoxin domain-containing protein [Candidatus Bipolaricaulota bacterium]MDW8329118.1 cupredoxin domain-containing protein [Candidatus Bipolaricaulota bacterium]